MGNNCCSGGSKSKKPSAFAPSDNSYGFQPDPSHGEVEENYSLQSASLQLQDSTVGQQQQQQQNADGQAQFKALREEQNRLDLIVQMAGRGMVSVRSTRGSTGYFDQGFAAALGQHLEQTTKFPDRLPIRLPPMTSASSDVFQLLSQPQWDNIALGKEGSGLAGCNGENPNTYIDHVAVNFLDSVVSKKELTFHGGVGPMVENLL